MFSFWSGARKTFALKLVIHDLLGRGWGICLYFVEPVSDQDIDVQHMIVGGINIELWK
jgi:hypothetical protein